jgi:twitching motility protein PilT
MDKDTVDALFTSMLESGEGVSDLLFIAGKPPLVEIHGQLHEFPIDTPDSLLGADLIANIAEQITENNERLLAQFDTAGSCDCSYTIDNVARFRVNVFKQNGRRAVVMRKLQSSVPTFETLGLPPVFREIVKEKNGIVLVTGASGSGKTTTLAAMVNAINQTQSVHIVTLEDPIEFLHPHARAAVSHRELGKDFPNFAEGLRSALRQAPKVILLGEIRDRETMEIAMTAAETGHLVFSTLHTINAGQSLNRILGFFSRDEETQIRQRFADTLRYIVSQRLVSKKEEGRLLISEIMGSNLRTRETIRYGESETKNFHEIIDAATTLGWLTFDQSLLRACEADLVTEETAMLYCTNKSSMHRELDLLAKRQGEHRREHSSGLKLDRPRAPMANRVITPSAKPLTDAVSRPG